MSNLSSKIIVLLLTLFWCSERQETEKAVSLNQAHFTETGILQNNTSEEKYHLRDHRPSGKRKSIRDQSHYDATIQEDFYMTKEHF